MISLSFTLISTNIAWSSVKASENVFMATILIAGCGYIGTFLGASLADAGHSVFGLCRTAENRDATIGIHWVSADLTDPGSLTVLSKAITHVVYAPAPGGGSDPERYERIYHRGLRNLCTEPFFFLFKHQDKDPGVSPS